MIGVRVYSFFASCGVHGSNGGYEVGNSEGDDGYAENNYYIN